MPIAPPPNPPPPPEVAMDAYSRRGLLGAIARFAWMTPLSSPFVSGCHVVPPSVDLKIPPPLSLHDPFSHGPCRASQRAAYTVFGFDGSMTTSEPPVFSSLPRTFSNVWPPSVDR